MEESVKVELEAGLQSRAASQFVQEANRYTAHLFLEKDKRRINAKSIMGLMSLAITTGETVTLIAEGDDEREALNKLTEFISNTPQSH